LSEEDRAARLEIINKQAIQYDELMIKYDQRNKEKKTDTY
jgi:hypothetical protein